MQASFSLRIVSKDFKSAATRFSCVANEASFPIREAVGQRAALLSRADGADQRLRTGCAHLLDDLSAVGTPFLPCTSSNRFGLRSTNSTRCFWPSRRPTAAAHRAGSDNERQRHIGPTHHARIFHGASLYLHQLKFQLEID
jgi:hypothetical protein